MNLQENRESRCPQIPWHFARHLLPGAVYGYVHTSLRPFVESATPLTDKVISDSLARYVGIFTDIDKDELPQEFINPLVEFSDRFPMQNWYPIMRNELDDILSVPFIELDREEISQIIPSDPASRRVFQFLGYPDAETFIPGIGRQILSLTSKYEIPTQQYEDAITLAERVLTGISRYSKEPYICHIYRTIWYYLTAQEHLGALSQKDHGFVGRDLATIVMHVLLEDGKGVTLSESHLYGTPPKYTLLTPFGDIDNISPSQYVTLKALQAWDKRRDLRNVIGLDPSGKAAELKLFDRMDNTLTTWHKTNWRNLIKFLYETYTSMGLLGWTARFSGNFFGNLKMLYKLADGRHWEAILATNLISHGMYMAGVEEIKGIFTKRMQQQYGMEFTHATLDRWMQDFLSKYRGIPCSSFPQLFSLKTNVVDKYMEKNIPEESSHQPFGQTFPSRPFGFQDLIPYMKTVWDTGSLTPFTPYYPGKAYAVYADLPMGFTLKWGVKQLLGIHNIPSIIKKRPDESSKF